MDISSIASQFSAGSQQNMSKLADDFDSFLKLLTTQLQYQDPLEPLDANQFTEQLVSFTGVEQQISMNKNLETLIGQMWMQDLSNSVSYIGKDVFANTDAAQLKNGQAKWTYSLDLMADESKLVVRNAQGVAVYQTDGALAAGNHEFQWDGRDNSGELLPDGIYRLGVEAKNGGSAVNTEIFVRGRVDGVEREDAESKLSVNGMLLGVDKIQAVLMPDGASGG